MSLYEDAKSLALCIKMQNQDVTFITRWIKGNSIKTTL